MPAMSKMPEISVIVPVYNSEKYLDDCIRSIIGQSYTDWELLLIDDGSTDSSGKICDGYALQDSRIKVLHKENGGVSSSRNLGLDNACGNWVTFIDSDDWVEQDYLSDMAAHADSDVEIVMSYPKTYTEKGLELPAEHYGGLIASEDFSLLFSECGIGKYTYSVCKLYSLPWLREKHLRFPENISMGEDHIFLYEAILDACKVYVSPHSNYCYRYVASGLSKQLQAPDSEYYVYQRLYELINQIISRYSIKDYKVLQQFDAIIVRYVNRVLRTLYTQTLPRQKRLQILYSLDFSRINYKECGFSGFAKRILYSRHCIVIYDFLKYAMRSLKNLL